MRFIRPRFGIVLWCAIALLIAIVPLWRLRAMRQVKSSLPDVRESSLQRVNQDWKPSTRFGLTAALSQRAAREFPDDTNAQIAALDVTQFVEQAKDLSLSTSYAPYQNRAELARAQAILAARAKSGWKSTDAYFARFDALEERFPNSKLVRAAHLHAAMFGMLKINEGPVIIGQGTKMAREQLSLRYESWMSPAAIESAIETAREGARLEPDNAFWPWMEAILARSLARNAAALRALNQAGSKARFDDYSSAITAARLDTLSRLRPIGWEDEWSEISAAPDAHFYKMRSLARAVLYEMKLSRARGDQKNAFAWGAATARASAVVALENPSLTGKFVGEALCYITWRGAAEDIAGAPALPPQNASDAQRAAYTEAFKQSNATRFAQLCRENGDQEMAHQTLQTFASFDARQLIEQNSSQTNVFAARVWSLAKLGWLNSYLLRVSLITMILWGVCWLLTRKFNDIAPLRAQMLMPTMFLAGISGVLLVAARGFAPELQTLRQTLFVLEPLAPTPTSNGWALATAWPPYLGALWMLFTIICAIRALRREHIESKTASFRFSAKLLVALALLCGFVLSLLIDITTPPAPGDEEKLSAAFWVWLGCSCLGGVVAILWSRGKARPVAVCLAGALWMGIASLWIGNVSALPDGLFYGRILLFIAAILFLLALYFILRNIGTFVVNFKTFAIHFAASTRIAAGALALLCAVAYLGITLWSVPVEAKTRAMMNRQLQIGEVAWLREQIGAR